MKSQAIILNNGDCMPVLGLGTWKSLPDKVGNAVEYALSVCGYNHIDCAAIYRNEKEIGASFKKIFEKGTRKRGDVFITSKLWNTDHQKKDVRKACESTLADLNLDYLDLYLMHWGIASFSNSVSGLTERLDRDGLLITKKVSLQETWNAMEALVKKGIVKAIGVANFTAPMLIDLLSYAKIPPAINQIELHPYLQQSTLVDFCKYKNIAVTAYSPLGSPGNYIPKGLPSIAEDKVIKKIAHQHKKSEAQVMIRWGIQRGTVVIPKSVTPKRIKENGEVFDFELSNTQMNAIASIDHNLRFVNPYAWWKIPYFS